MSRIIVIGGGVSGLSIAARLAQATLPVTVLEASRLGFGSSTRNQGWLHSGAWFAREQPELARMCYESLRMTLQLCPACREPQHDSMLWIFSETITDVGRWTAAWKAAGIPFEGVPARIALQRLPGLEPTQVREAFQLPDRSIRFDLLLRRLALEARKAGVEIRSPARVASLMQTGPAIEGVITEEGERIPAQLVILAGHAAGLRLVPQYLNHETGGESDLQLMPLKAHLLGLQPELAKWPFCIPDADGFSHMPHAPTSVFGTSRWFPVADPQNQAVVPSEIEEIWMHLHRFFPSVKREEHKILPWAGVTVQAIDEIEPSFSGFPTVVDHENRSERRLNLLSVFPGRGTLWPQLAEQTKKVVLQKLQLPLSQIADPPWQLTERAHPREAQGDGIARRLRIYHCQKCGNMVSREATLPAPICCGVEMALAATG